MRRQIFDASGKRYVGGEDSGRSSRLVIFPSFSSRWPSFSPLPTTTPYRPLTFAPMLCRALISFAKHRSRSLAFSFPRLLPFFPIGRFS
jgi:hypothetical protein